MIEQTYDIEIGYNGAAGAGGDAAANFSIDADRARWFAKTFFKGLVASESNSGYVRITGESKSIVLSCTNYKEPDYDSLELPTPKSSSAA